MKRLSLLIGFLIAFACCDLQAQGKIDLQTSDTILTKFLFLSGASLIVTVALYHFLVRPFALTRFLFGMKPAKE